MLAKIATLPASRSLAQQGLKIKTPGGKSMGNEGKINAVTLRKLREIRGLSRKEVAVLLGIGHKSVEKFENGRTILNKTRIEQIVRNYGFTYDEFLLCRAGKSEHIQKRFCHKKEKPVNNRRKRRFLKKIITKEARVLRMLRNLKNISQYKASLICGYHKGAIGHIEMGRIQLPKNRIIHIVKSYGFKVEDFESHMKADVLVTEP